MANLLANVLQFLSDLIFSSLSWGWWVAFFVITLGIVCIPIRIALRNYS